MKERMSVGPVGFHSSLTYDPDKTELLGNTEYLNGFGVTSPNGQYTICGIDACSAVTLFVDDDLVYEKFLVGPYELAVANTGIAAVSGFTEGGYGDGNQMLYVWDADGNELVSEEMRATTESIVIDPTGQYAAVYTEQVLEKFDENTPWDFSVYILDIKDGTFRTRYTDQIPGVRTSGPRRKQIEKLQFVSGGSEIYIALSEQRDPTLDIDAPPKDDDDGEITAGNLAEVTGGPFKGETVRVDQVRGPEEKVTVLVDYEDYGSPSMEMDVRRDRIQRLTEEETPAESVRFEDLCEMTIDDIPANITLIDLNGNVVQKGHPRMSAFPAHYKLTDKAKKRLGVDADDKPGN